MSKTGTFSPDWVVCLDCESPCYIFEWRDGQVIEAICTVCGNDDPEAFMAPGDFEDLQEDER